MRWENNPGCETATTAELHSLRAPEGLPGALQLLVGRRRLELALLVEFFHLLEEQSGKVGLMWIPVLNPCAIPGSMVGLGDPS